MSLPRVALSIQQPWAWLIANGHKDVENRTWRHSFRGEVLIHAGKRSDAPAMDHFRAGRHPVTYDGSLAGLPPPEERFGLFNGEQQGGIVGVAEIVDCVDHHDSEWFVGPFGFVIRNARPLAFAPMKGALGFFAATYPEDEA